MLADAQDAVVLIDTFNTDAMQIVRRMQGRAPVILLQNHESLARLERMLADRRPRIVWHVRNTHDVSPGGLNRAVERKPAEGRKVTAHLFQSYSRLERFLIRLAGRPEQPTHFYQILKFERLRG